MPSSETHQRDPRSRDDSNREEFRRAIENIKLRAPIEDVVRERVPALKKRGALWVACCPFHEERTPSFTVDPRRGTWHCFGACGTGGDQISFLTRFDNIAPIDAIEILAARTGIELPRRARSRPEEREAADTLLGLLESATRFYQAQLRTSEGQASARYMRSRGLSDVTADAFGIGHAPANGQAFVNFTREQALDLADCEKAGLVRRTDEGRPYDFFRGRLMIPIRDVRGRTIGFGARRLVDNDEAGPKYINTAETELFRKGRLVYAFDRALPVVRRSGHIVLVEGYTDVMAAHQVGLANVVAVLGTATTDDHAGLIKKTGARRISLVFDGDEAGRKAAYKALHGLLPLELEIDVVSLQGGDDPCDLLVRDGATAFNAQLEQAQSWFDFLLVGLRGLRGIELSREVDRVLELMMRLSKPVHRDARVAELAAALNLPVAGLRAQLEDLPAMRAAARTARTREESSPKPASSATATDRLLVTCFEEMLGAVLLDAGVFPMVRPYLGRCPDAELQRVFAAISALYDEPDGAIDVSTVLSFLADDSARNRVEPAVHVPVDEDYTPKRLVEAQIAFLSRRERDARFQEEHRAFRDLESQMLRDKGEHAAASDPALIDLARRLAYESDTTPSTKPQSADVEDPIHHG